jgi:hypothetical protein
MRPPATEGCTAASQIRHRGRSPPDRWRIWESHCETYSRARVEVPTPRGPSNKRARREPGASHWKPYLRSRDSVSCRPLKGPRDRGDHRIDPSLLSESMRNENSHCYKNSHFWIGGRESGLTPGRVEKSGGLPGRLHPPRGVGGTRGWGGNRARRGGRHNFERPYEAGGPPFPMAERPSLTLQRCPKPARHGGNPYFTLASCSGRVRRWERE